MMLRKKPKPKKLSLRQVHELYLLLKDALPEKEEENLTDEVEKILERTVEGTLLKSLHVMYKSVPDNPIDAIIFFTKGLKESEFFEYVVFVKGLKKING